MLRSFILLNYFDTYLYLFCTRQFGTKMLKQTSWHQGFKTDNLAPNMQCFDVASLLNASEPPGSRSSCGLSVPGRENKVFYLIFYQHLRDERLLDFFVWWQIVQCTHLRDLAQVEQHVQSFGHIADAGRGIYFCIPSRTKKINLTTLC